MCFLGYHLSCGAEQGQSASSTFAALAGPSGRARRLDVFRALLQALEPQQRFAAAARLTQDVLTAVVDEVMPLTCSVRVG